MGKMIGILLGVVAIWLGLEVYNNGLEGAFGGAFAGSDAAATQQQSVPQRAGAAVENAHAASDERRSRLLGD